MLNACWMHALHMWTRLASALMFISVPLFASRNNQTHTEQCVSKGVWCEQVSKKNTSWTTCKAHALAPLRSCCTLLSHKCGWAFGSSVHVDWQVQWSIRFCTEGWWQWNKHPKFEWKMYFLTVLGAGPSPNPISKKSGPTHSIYDTSTWIALRACPTLP